jgi:pimeloyl-ACP methyl ester carboxylesterase
VYLKSIRFSAFVAVLCLFPAISFAAESRLQIDSDGWSLIGDLTLPTQSPPSAFALLLHKAAGDRRAFAPMAQALAIAGIASLRIDLRGHGDSTNLGAFDADISRYFDSTDPRVVENFALTRSGDRDIVAIMDWLDAQSRLSSLPLVIVGSSYTGQEMVEAAVDSRFADVYVALAPGSFTVDSIARIDPSGVPWLFVRAEVELPFFPDLFAAIREGSDTAEIWVLPGKGHATDLFDHNDDLERRLVEWVLQRLPYQGTAKD